MIPRSTLTWCAALSGLVLFGCPNAEGEFNAFQDRYETIHPSTDAGSGGGSSCSSAPTAGDVDGSFLFTLSASLDPKSPVLFDAELTTEDGASGLEFRLKLQALDTCDRQTKVGDVFDLGPFPVNADGTFTAQLPPLEVTGLSNPFSENAITAEVALIGSLCAPADFICGEVTGQVTKPSDISLAKSTFTMERLATPGTYPTDIQVNCGGTLANTTLPPKCNK